MCPEMKDRGRAKNSEFRLNFCINKNFPIAALRSFAEGGFSYRKTSPRGNAGMFAVVCAARFVRKHVYRTERGGAGV